MAGRSQSTFRDKENEPHPHSILTALRQSFALQLRVPSQVSTRSGPKPESSADPEANAKETRLITCHHLQQKKIQADHQLLLAGGHGSCESSSCFLNDIYKHHGFESMSFEFLLEYHQESPPT
jgi:hypothetical protein